MKNRPDIPAHFPKLTNLRPNEEVEMVLKRHWFVLVHTFVYLAVLVKIPLLAFWFRDELSIIFPIEFVALATIVFVAVFALFIYVDWIANELDFFVFTNERIIGIEQVSFLNRVISECSIDRVQEVNASSSGLLANIFNFGTVDIRTASETSQFEMHTVPSPIEQARHIQNIVQEFKNVHPSVAAATPAPAQP